jgi:adenylate cyclase
LIRFWRALRAPGRPLALAIIALAVLIRLIDPAPVQQLRLAVFDREQALLPRPSLGEASPVRIVQIDDDSIAKYGQWPWPRTLLATLIEKIAEAKPKVLAIDILFAAPDRTSPPVLAQDRPDLPAELRDALARLPSNDSRLAEAIAEVPTVLGLKLDDRETAPPAPSDADLVAAVPHYATAVESIWEIARSAKAVGSISVEPDVDGVFRRLPLVAVREGTLVPGFAVAALDVATGVPAVPRLRPSVGGVEVTVDHGFAPADGTGAAWVYFTPQTPFYSAMQLLDGSLDLAGLNDRVVLLAVTNAGSDLQRTPLGLMYGVEFHAQWIDTLLSGTRLSRLPFADRIEPALLLLLGLATIWLFPYEKPLLATGLSAALVITLLGGEFALFGLAGLLADGVYPAIGILAAFGTMLQGSLGAAQTARRRLEVELQREREERARINGELAAARSIQMGLLPLRFPAFPERRDIEVYARVEPARSVGGDLFDFLLIDENRLFFMIADVSGKGIPAALFMAMTKEVLRDAAARHRTLLDRLLGQANDKIASASAEFAADGSDMMFVTAFAGILDLASGAVVYASAGHDSPFVIGPDRQLRQFATEGGPPLGAVDDFAFPLDRGRLEPGEILLLFTDGVTEAQDETGALYSAERLSALLATVPAETAEGAVSVVFEDVRRFAAGAEQADDITVLALRRIAVA